MVKDRVCLENVQRRATKLVSAFKDKSCSERLILLGLTTLKIRSVRDDLIDSFKIWTNHEKLNKDDFLQLADQQHGVRGHTLKLFEQRCRTTIHANSFSMRVVDEWNALLQGVVDTTIVNCFKNRLERFWSLDMKP